MCPVATQVITGSQDIMKAAAAASLAQEASLYKEVTSAQVGLHASVKRAAAAAVAAALSTAVIADHETS